MNEPEKRVKTAVILAAGRGSRLRPYTHDIPKGFMNVGDETLIERSIRILRENGIEQIIIGTGHLSGHYETLAKKLGLLTYKNPDFASTGSFHTLFCGEAHISGDFLLLESDLLYHSQAISALLAFEKSDVILCSGFTQSNDEVYVEAPRDLLKNLSKKKQDLQSVDGELVGIWKISQKLFVELIKHHSEDSDSHAKDYEVAIAHSNYPVDLLKIEDLVWCEIDNEEHLERARKKILPRID